MILIVISYKSGALVRYSVEDEDVATIIDECDLEDIKSIQIKHE